jgi:hypothetical protein
MPAVSTAAEVHADAPPDGLVEVSTLPALSAATHSVFVLHVSPKISFPESTATGIVHPGLAPAGSLAVITDVDATANDGFSIPTQYVVDGHEIAASGPATDVDVQSVATVVVGFVVARISPLERPVGSPVATHIVADAHVIAPRLWPVNERVCHTALGPAAGSVVLSIDPSVLTATQSVVVGHEIPLNGYFEVEPGKFICGVTPDLTVQAADPPVGSVEVITLPPESTATHSFVEGQETPTRYGPWSPIVVTRQAWDGSVDVMTASEEVIPFTVGPIATHSDSDGQETPAATEIAAGFGSRSADSKLHASGDGVSASAGAASEPAAARLTTTTNAIMHARITGRILRA